MKAVVVGNGVAGITAARSLREADPEAEIVVFADEPHPYYPRPNLIEWIAGRLPRERLSAFPAGWYAERRIEVRLGRRVRRILPDEKAVEAGDGAREPYDALCLADGAVSAVPPIPGADRPGVHTLRTLADAEAILAAVAARPETVVVGGGLLGLEIARALKARGARVTVLEIFPFLLPRQLDAAGGAVLARQLEGGGVRVRTGAATEEILGTPDVAGVRLKSGEVIPAGTVLLAAGIRPNVGLAREAGLTVDRGVVVDDGMAASRPGIYAAGDNAQHRGRLYGIIPAAFEQARTAAASMAGLHRPYAGTVPSNTLKVAGLHLTSVGLVNPDAGAAGIEELRREDAAAGLYRKIVLDGGRLVGAVWMGSKDGVPQLVQAVAARKPVEAFKREILADGFDFARLASQESA